MIRDVKILDSQVLSDNYYSLKKYRYSYSKADGSQQTQTREVYDRGNGAAILLYNREQRTVILIRQFRLPTYVNGNESGILVEVCAGLLDEKESPEEAIGREAEEETGYKVKEVKKVFEAYMSPGSVSEMLYFFVAEYTPEMKTAQGGGLEVEEENIDVLELPFDQAIRMMAAGEIRDAKTIMLLQYAQLASLL